MRRFLAVLLTGLLALLVVSAGPAVAKPPMRGDFDLMLVPPETCGMVAWSGTVDFGGSVHGLYLSFTDVASVFRGQTQHFEEYFTVVDEPLAPGSCPDGSQTMLLTGWDFGVGVFANYTFRDNGVVTDTSPDLQRVAGTQSPDERRHRLRPSHAGPRRAHAGRSAAAQLRTQEPVGSGPHLAANNAPLSAERALLRGSSDH